MHIEFEDSDLKELVINHIGLHKYKKVVKNAKFMDNLTEVVKTLSLAESTSDLKMYSSLHYEKLKHQTRVLSSVRIMNNRIERLIFEELEDGVKIVLVELNTNHYGNNH